MSRLITVLLVLGLLALLIVGGGAWYMNRDATPAQRFRTVRVARGDVVATISATGTVEPQEVVDVGAQVAGIINSFGKDKNGKPVNFGSVVEQGLVLAEIDQSLYSADVASAKAQMAQDQAAVVRCQADLLQMKAKLVQAQRDWDRAQKLGPGDALAEQAYDTYQAAFETAKANVAVDEAAIVQAKATVDKDQADLDRAKQNIGYCTITSPVNGIIIDRRVNIGQTVVSSLNAPSLFLIAKDLTKMQVWVSVNEADIGSIRVGQRATFTADAFPGTTFTGTVGRIRLNATITQNVVTYTVEVDTDNSNGKLLPYLSANIDFEAARHDQVLTVPVAALHWTPQPTQVAPNVPRNLDAIYSSIAPTRPESTTQTSPAANVPATHPAGQQHRRHDDQNSAHSRGLVWVQDGEFVRPIPVRLGITDGVTTEVVAGQVTEDMQVVVGDAAAAASDDAGTTNPFLPQFRRRPSGSAQGGPPPH